MKNFCSSMTFFTRKRIIYKNMIFLALLEFFVKDTLNSSFSLFQTISLNKHEIDDEFCKI